mgnify:CR=1 FL=1
MQKNGRAQYVRKIMIKLRHKYGAKATTKDSKRFGSKKEADFYAKLECLRKAGEILFFVRQCPIDLPCGTTHRIDFLVFWAYGRAEFIEVK